MKTYSLKQISLDAVYYNPIIGPSFGQDDLTVHFYDTYGLVTTESDGNFDVNLDSDFSELSGGY